MATIEYLKSQLKHILIENHGDLDIDDYPTLRADATELGLDQGATSRLLQVIYNEINWKPYNQIDDALNEILFKGIIHQEQVIAICSEVKDQLDSNEVEAYIQSLIKNKGFKPREKNNVDPESLLNKWMTDQYWEEYKNTLTEVEWLGEKVNSISQLADITFRKPTEAQYFLRNSNYLPPLIAVLTRSAGQADEYAKIIEFERNAETRYLKVLYRLNNQLPYLFNGKHYFDIRSLIHDAFSTFDNSLTLYQHFKKGYLSIWLNTDLLLKQNDKNDFNTFLRWAYQNDSSLPIYINQKAYFSPVEIINLNNTPFVRQEFSGEFRKGTLGLWLNAIGRSDLNDSLNVYWEKLLSYKAYNDNDLDLAIYQKFVELVDSQFEYPRIELDQYSIQLLSIESGSLYNHPLKLSLLNDGYIKVDLSLPNNQTGISLDQNSVQLNSIISHTEQTINLIIDTNQLKKDEVYNLNIKVQTPDEELSIPVSVKVVFPKRAYIRNILIYSLISATVVGVWRYLYSTLVVDINKSGIDQFFHPDNASAAFWSIIFLIGFLWVGYKNANKLNGI